MSKKKKKPTLIVQQYLRQHRMNELKKKVKLITSIS